MSERLIVAIGGVIIMCIAFMAICGYFLNVKEYYQWFGPMGMSFNSALCFEITGVCLILVAFYKKPPPLK